MLFLWCFILYLVFGMMNERMVGHRLEVPFIQQNLELPRGCEVTSLAMVLNYVGVDVSKMELARNIDKVPFEINGYIGDMNEGFLGNMYTKAQPGLGVYVYPILKLANQYLPDRIVNLTGEPVEKLYEMIDQGSPVWVLTNAKFKKLKDVDFQTVYKKNGAMKVTYWQHSVVLTGYNDRYVFINDPLAESPNKKVKRKDFEKAWLQMGSQALSIKP